MGTNRYGIWTSYRAIGEENAEDAAKVADRLGFGALWLGGSPRLASLRPLLAGSEQLIIGTSIVNVWQYEPTALCEEYHALEAEFPGRLIVGLGIGHPEATGEYEKPLAKMRGFLDAIAAAPAPIPSDRLIVAALGPRMLALSGERTLGTIPYFTPPQHTATARAALPAPKLVVPELAVVLGEPGARARTIAREYAAGYLSLSNYTANLLRCGFTAADLEDGGSDRLIDTLIPQGNAEELAPHVQAHLKAGADQICVQTLGVEGVPETEWAALAGALGL